MSDTKVVTTPDVRPEKTSEASAEQPAELAALPAVDPTTAALQAAAQNIEDIDFVLEEIENKIAPLALA